MFNINLKFLYFRLRERDSSLITISTKVNSISDCFHSRSTFVQIFPVKICTNNLFIFYTKIENTLERVVGSCFSVQNQFSHVGVLYKVHNNPISAHNNPLQCTQWAPRVNFSRHLLCVSQRYARRMMVTGSSLNANLQVNIYFNTGKTYIKWCLK